MVKSTILQLYTDEIHELAEIGKYMNQLGHHPDSLHNPMRTDLDGTTACMANSRLYHEGKIIYSGTTKFDTRPWNFQGLGRNENTGPLKIFKYF